MKCICINSACQIFNFGESYTRNITISFYANMVFVQLRAENSAHSDEN